MDGGRALKPLAACRAETTRIVCECLAADGFRRDAQVDIPGAGRREAQQPYTVDSRRARDAAGRRKTFAALSTCQSPPGKIGHHARGHHFASFATVRGCGFVDPVASSSPLEAAVRPAACIAGQPAAAPRRSRDHESEHERRVLQRRLVVYRWWPVVVRTPAATVARSVISHCQGPLVRLCTLLGAQRTVFRCLRVSSSCSAATTTQRGSTTFGAQVTAAPGNSSQRMPSGFRVRPRHCSRAEMSCTYSAAPTGCCLLLGKAKSSTTSGRIHSHTPRTSRFPDFLYRVQRQHART